MRCRLRALASQPFPQSRQPLEYTQPYPVVKRYHNRFWSCFSRFESWPGSLDELVSGMTLRDSKRAPLDSPDRRNQVRPVADKTFPEGLRL